ncbi:ROK family protein [Streptomyces tubbatahanensis]|uniref:ROK family protein n=1 Tax=Streptomyces tubbatahanensis TaxID=2923272 RepID=A0ABY3XM76_9ACTN|nr:ROK family protein [Streptomyces tubbatahanensis]UNS95517.1 ROK family protein [Streptomyces tubbatahanensis]
MTHPQHGGARRTPPDRPHPDCTGRPVLALDIGGTKLAAGVVTADGGTQAFAVCPTGVGNGPEACLKRLFDLGEDVLTRAGVAPAALLGTGIGCGGPLDSATGLLIAPPHLPGWRDIPVTRLAEERFGPRAVLDNDGTAGAAGQWRFGAGRGCRHLLYLTISTGIGGGVVLEGRTFRGAAGNGGEPGHVTVRSGGRRCDSCGRAGCLEAYASGTSLARRAAEAATEARLRGESTALGRTADPTAAQVAAAARHGDAVATRVWDETVDLLAGGLTTLVNVFEPDLVVLGGGVTRAGEQLLAPVRQLVAARAMGPAAGAARIVRAARADQAGVLGAAAIAFERLTNPHRDQERHG